MPNTCATNDTKYSKTGFDICPVRNIPDPPKESLGNYEIGETKTKTPPAHCNVYKKGNRNSLHPH
jgi:hypothetical protein